MSSTLVARLQRTVQPLVLLLALLFIGLLLRSQWSQLAAFEWQVRPEFLMASALFLVLAGLLEVVMWRHILGLIGGQLAWPRALRIWFSTSLVRYIPGNVWQPLGMTVLCHREGVPPETTVVSVALYQAVNLLSVAPIAAFYLVGTGNLGLLSSWLGANLRWAGMAALFPVLLFLVRPDLLLTLLNWALRRVGRRPLPVRLSSRQLMGLLFLAWMDWGLWGCGFAALVFSFLPMALREPTALLPHLLAAYPMAYALGYLSFLTPSGLAVREGVLYFFLAPVLGAGEATLVAVAMRIWQIVLEVGLAALALLLLPKREL